MNCPHGLDPFTDEGCVRCFNAAVASAPRTMAAFKELNPTLSEEQRKGIGRVLMVLAQEFVEQQERALALRIRMLAAQLNPIDPLGYLEPKTAAKVVRAPRAKRTR